MRESEHVSNGTLNVPASVGAPAGQDESNDEVSAGTHPRLVGRESELLALDSLLEESNLEGFRVLALSGEPGIGKTRILSELAKRGKTKDWLTLRGSAAEFETELPLAVIIDCVDPYLQALNPRSVNRFDPATLAELAEIFPGLSSHRTMTATPKVSSERFRSYHAIRKLIEDLGTRQNLMLLLDDCQWADQASLELITHLLRRPPDASVLLAVAYRSNWIQPSIEADLIAGQSNGMVRRINLGPLNSGEVQQLLSGTESKRSQEQLFEETGGNPFYVLELSKSMAGGTQVGVEPAPNSIVPSAVGAAISGEIMALSTTARNLLNAAAVAGDPFDIDETRLISELEQTDLIDALDELNRIGITVPTDQPRRFSFRHPLVRNSVYELIPPGTRLLLHERAVEALNQLGAVPTRMATHVERAARPGDAKSAEILVVAAEAVQAQAPAIALGWFEAARKILVGVESQLMIRLFGGLASSAAACGRFDEAFDALVRCIELVGDENPPVRVTLVAACARLELIKGEYEASVQRLLSALDELNEPESEAATELMLQLASGAVFAMDRERLTHWSRCALSTARKLEDRKLIATASATRALSASSTGDVDEAVECRHEAAEMVAQMTDGELAQNVDTINWLCVSELYLELFNETIEHAELGLRVSRATGQAQSFFLLYPCLAHATNMLGELEQSTTLLDEAVEASRIARNDQGLVWALIGRTLTAITRGDIRLAEASIGAFSDASVDVGHGLIGGWSGAVTAAVHFEQGRFEQALNVLHEKCGGETLPLVPSSWRARYLALQVSIFIRLDQAEAAERAVDLAESEAERFARPISRSFAFRARTELDIARGRTEDAVDAARRAVSEFGDEHAPVERALCRLWLGRALAANGQREEAMVELDRALEVFTSRGAERYVKETERELRQLGRRLNRRGKPAAGEFGMESLTERELEVARLVTDRRTNREIAEMLFLSVKTVETHLRNIFSKLGVKSRVEVARQMESSGSFPEDR